MESQSPEELSQQEKISLSHVGLVRDLLIKVGYDPNQKLAVEESQAAYFTIEEPGPNQLVPIDNIYAERIHNTELPSPIETALDHTKEHFDSYRLELFIGENSVISIDTSVFVDINELGSEICVGEDGSPIMNAEGKADYVSIEKVVNMFTKLYTEDKLNPKTS